MKLQKPVTKKANISMAQARKAVDGYIKRSRIYYQAWLDNDGPNEAVRLPLAPPPPPMCNVRRKP